MKTFATLLGISLIALCTTAIAAPPQPHKKPTKLINSFYCPAISALKFDQSEHTWYVKPNWKSYDISFVRKITAFYGAQWNGAAVGQITCVYHGANPDSFAIKLIFHTLTKNPHRGKWSKNLGGYKNCISRKQEDCPFSVNIKPKIKNFYQTIERLKGTTED